MHGHGECYGHGPSAGRSTRDFWGSASRGRSISATGAYCRCRRRSATKVQFSVRQIFQGFIFSGIKHQLHCAVRSNGLWFFQDSSTNCIAQYGRMVCDFFRIQTQIALCSTVNGLWFFQESSTNCIAQYGQWSVIFSGFKHKLHFTANGFSFFDDSNTKSNHYPQADLRVYVFTQLPVEIALRHLGAGGQRLEAAFQRIFRHNHRHCKRRYTMSGTNRKMKTTRSMHTLYYPVMRGATFCMH